MCTSPPTSRWSATLLGMVAVAIGLSACDNPRKAALRELEKRGVAAGGAALLQAASASDLTTLDLLLQAEVHPDLRDSRGRTPLFAAIDRGDLGVVFRLIKGGANPSLGIADGTTPLSLAVARGELAVADKLLEAGAWPDGRMPDGDTLVPWAIRHGRLWVLERVLEAGLDPNQHDTAGNPLVHVAFDAKREELLDRLLKDDADPSARDKQGNPLAHKAFQAGRFDLVKRLLESKADPSARNAAGQTLLHAALAGRQRDMVECLLAHGADAAPPSPAGEATLIVALQQGMHDLLPALRHAGADCNAADKSGRTPLSRALEAGEPEWIGALAAMGSDPGPGGWHPLYQELIRTGDHRAVRALLGAGVAPNGHDARGRPLVVEAFDAGQHGIACLLVQFGAPAGDALWDACLRGDLAAARLLLDHGASPNPTRAPWADTPLYASVRGGNGAVTGLLLERGASPAAHGVEGQSVLHLAVALGHDECVRHLLEHGADPNSEVRRPVKPAFLARVRGGTMRWLLLNDSRITPLMLAVDSGSHATTRLLVEHGARTEVWTRSTHMWPINLAARKADVKTMRVLLGKDPEKEQRKIVIDLSDQEAKMFDAAGNEVFKTKVSTGRSGFRTPTGEFAITNKHREWTSTLYHASMPYFQRLSCGDFGLHQGYVPGHPASHGCIRVPYGKASELFQLTELGDRVQIVP